MTCRRSIALHLALGVLSACSASHKGPFVPIGEDEPAASADASDAGRVSRPNPASADAAAPNLPEPELIDQTGVDNPAGLAPAQVDMLRAGGPLGKLRWLYPYDQTVFPGGTVAPTLMWEGDPATQAIYLRMKSSDFEFKTVIKPMAEGGSALGAIAGVASTPEQPAFQLPQEIWNKAARHTRGASDPFQLELSTLVRGQVAGPIVLHIGIAQGHVQGSIYYTSYFSELTRVAKDPAMLATAKGSSTFLRIPSGGSAQVVTSAVDGKCAGCHAVSANGVRMITQVLPGPTEDQAPRAYSFQLDPAAASFDPAAGATHQVALGDINAGLAALYPDGSKFLMQSRAVSGAWSLYGDILDQARQTSSPKDAQLYDSVTGQIVADTGIPPGALMPMFSPDGTRLVFNDVALGNAHGLALMDYDPQHHKASGYRTLMQENLSAVTRPAWPNFLPDNRAVVFIRTDNRDFASSNADVGTILQYPKKPDGSLDASMTRHSLPPGFPSSDPYIVDVSTGKVTLLARAAGFERPSDADIARSYLPYGLDDAHHNYNTTVSPVASGGYFWVFFDSLRNYGNRGLTRAIWGAAVDIHPDGSYTTDPSHPAFYVAGQEFGPDNHRAFAARDLCKNLEEPCASGIDCCSGFCSATGAQGGGACVPPKQACANHDEHCATRADCCDPSAACINQFCAFIELF